MQIVNSQYIKIDNTTIQKFLNNNITSGIIANDIVTAI